MSSALSFESRPVAARLVRRIRASRVAGELEPFLWARSTELSALAFRHAPGALLGATDLAQAVYEPVRRRALLTNPEFGGVLQEGVRSWARQVLLEPPYDSEGWDVYHLLAETGRLRAKDVEDDIEEMLRERELQAHAAGNEGGRSSRPESPNPLLWLPFLPDIRPELQERLGIRGALANLPEGGGSARLRDALRDLASQDALRPYLECPVPGVHVLVFRHAPVNLLLDPAILSALPDTTLHRAFIQNPTLRHHEAHRAAAWAWREFSLHPEAADLLHLLHEEGYLSSDEVLGTVERGLGSGVEPRGKAMGRLLGLPGMLELSPETLDDLAHRQFGLRARGPILEHPSTPLETLELLLDGITEGSVAPFRCWLRGYQIRGLRPEEAYMGSRHLGLAHQAIFALASIERIPGAVRLLGRPFLEPLLTHSRGNVRQRALALLSQLGPGPSLEEGRRAYRVRMETPVGEPEEERGVRPSALERGTRG